MLFILTFLKISSHFLPPRVCSITAFPYIQHCVFQDCKQRKTQLESSVGNKNNHKMLSNVKYKWFLFFFGFSSQLHIFITRRNKSRLALDKFNKQNSDSLLTELQVSFFFFFNPLQVFPRGLQSCL